MAAAEPFTLKVSDIYEVPLRGTLLRLKVAQGRPNAADVAVGKVIAARSPEGRELKLRILAHSITGGNVSQARLERVKELDVVVEPADESSAQEAVGFGWTVKPASS